MMTFLLLPPLEAFGDVYSDAINALVLWGLAILAVIAALVALCFRSVRRWNNPILWLSGLILTGAATFVVAGVVQEARTDAFFADDPGYAAAALPFTGRSIYVERPCLVALAAVGKMGNSLRGDCGVPLAAWLREGRVDFVEAGDDPIRRFRLHDGDPACHGPESDWVPDGYMVSAPYAICILGEDVAEVTADHRIEWASRDIPTKDWTYTEITLVETATGQIIDRFDSWTGATPYGGDTPPPEARRPFGPLAELLSMAAFVPEDADTSIDAHLLSLRPPDEAALVAAMGARYQRYKAGTIWFACRDDVRSGLSVATVAALHEGSKTIFGEGSTWRYPASCAPWARQGMAGQGRPPPPLPPLAPSLMNRP